MPERHDRLARALEALDERGLVAEVAEQQDGVAVARLEHPPELERLVGRALGVAEHDVVAVRLGL